MPILHIKKKVLSISAAFVGVITLFTCQGCCKNAYSHAKTTEGNQSCDRGKNSSSQKLIKMKNVEVDSNRKSGGSEPQKTHTVNQKFNPQKQM